MPPSGYGCCYAIGIEKYNDKADVSIAMHAALPKELGGKMRFYLEDVNDTEYTEILEGLEFATLVIFCNNLAFNQGTVSRLAVKMRCVMDYFAARAVKVVVISSRELPALEDRLYSSLPLQMTWNDEPHASNVYMSTPSAS
ncbi:hypothetical protein WJX72_008879 [[Myrmecia] bisecta]|uniref:Uncharacterized protein n=1 Tax=[Myrmecia] bisecta TaxID=41462 RepID=A0AAW1P495_9CHLO